MSFNLVNAISPERRLNREGWDATILQSQICACQGRCPFLGAGGSPIPSLVSFQLSLLTRRCAGPQWPSLRSPSRFDMLGCLACQLQVVAEALWAAELTQIPCFFVCKPWLAPLREGFGQILVPVQFCLLILVSWRSFGMWFQIVVPKERQS